MVHDTAYAPENLPPLLRFSVTRTPKGLVYKPMILISDLHVASEDKIPLNSTITSLPLGI